MWRALLYPFRSFVLLYSCFIIGGVRPTAFVFVFEVRVVVVVNSCVVYGIVWHDRGAGPNTQQQTIPNSRYIMFLFYPFRFWRHWHISPLCCFLGLLFSSSYIVMAISTNRFAWNVFPRSLLFLLTAGASQLGIITQRTKKIRQMGCWCGSTEPLCQSPSV